VALQFFLLAPYITVEALKALIAGEHPDVSPVGIALSVASLAFMPYLGRAKQRIGEAIGSVATTGEGRQNMLCAYLSAALLVGLAGNAAFGLWWLDPAVGLLIAALALKEGVEAWQGEGCCAPAAVPTERGLDHCCEDCCT
jgi:divalent metal cation (Fe/Co/Zn/Cd) transporter